MSRAMFFTIRILLVLFILVSVYAVMAFNFHLPFPLAMTPLNTLLGFSFALLHASQRNGWKRTLLLLGLTFVVSLTFESVGVATGLIYGPYHYSDRLGPLFLGLVPFLIPIAWFMMMYPSLVIAERLIPARVTGWKRTLAAAAVGGLVMTAWDVIMDPVMTAGGHWIWEVDGAFFGIPLQNFWGWWLTTFSTFALYFLLARPPADSARAGFRFDRLAITLYAVTGLATVLGAWLGGLGGPALAGFFAMTPWVVMGWVRGQE
ncbi:MAG: carotenoid biosynthesis protein [Chloroflexi bacterium]|nr:carotenoid biosynthesis protein [Chloroflexota bacterium]